MNNFKWQDYKEIIETNFTIIDKHQKEVPFLLNPPQLDFLKNLTDRNVILKARKMGFSSVLLAIAVVKFIYGKNERCMSMSFDQNASAKQLERAKQFIRSWERKNKIKMNMKYNSKSEMQMVVDDPEGEYINALRIGTAKSSAFGRGDDITFLHLTEVSSVDHLDLLLAGVGEAVTHGAIVTMETTANGYNDFKTFWDEASVGSRGYKTFFYDPTWEYDEAYIEQRRQNLGRLFDQEYPMTPELAFIASGQHYFDTQAMKEYLDTVKERKPISEVNNFRKYREWERGEFVLCFADTAAGGGDYCAAQFMSKNRLDVPLVYHKKTIATEMTPALHDELERIFDETGVAPVVAFERNNGGVFELERLNSLNRKGKYVIYQQKTGVGEIRGVKPAVKLGWDTNSATRPAMLSGLKDAVDNRLVTLYDRPTVNEMFSFVEVQTTSSWRAQAEQGAHDDLIMSLAGVWQMNQTEEPRRDRARRPKKIRRFDPVTGRALS